MVLPFHAARAFAISSASRLSSMAAYSSMAGFFGAAMPRLPWLGLSAAGARRPAAIVPMARVLEEELLAGLDDAEVAVLRRALASIGDRLAGDGPDQRSPSGYVPLSRRTIMASS